MSGVRTMRADLEKVRTADAGFGMIEVIVSLFILGLIAVAVVPILVQGLRLSIANAVVATATQLANQQVEQVRGTALCSAVTGATATTSAQHVPLKASRTVGSCPSTYPGTVSVSVAVTRTDTNAVVASASTLVFVTGP